MASEFSIYIKKNKSGLIVYLIGLALLTVSLVGRYYYLGISMVSLFLIYLLFVLTLYFGFDYRYLIGAGLLFLIISFFIILFRPKFELDYLYIHSKQTGLAAMGQYFFHRMADYFANYAFGFLIFGTISIFIDNLRNRFLKVFKAIFVSIIILMLLNFPLLIYFQTDCRNSLKDIGVSVGNKIKEGVLKTFNKNLYYSKKDESFINGEVKQENIKVFIDFPKEAESLSGIYKISGAAIDANSILNPGIDRIELFLGGDALKGMTIGNVQTGPGFIDGNNKTVSYINNIYIQFLNRRPTTQEFNYWITNLEYGIYTYYEVSRNILDSPEFRRRKLSNEKFLQIMYTGLFNRVSDESGLTYWLDQMKGGLDQNSVIEILINSAEFKIPVDEYYKVVKIKKTPISVLRNAVGDKYGKQFYLSGFRISFDSTKFSNGDYELYVYAHSPNFGWDFNKVNIFINN